MADAAAALNISPKKLDIPLLHDLTRKYGKACLKQLALLLKDGGLQ